MGSDWSLPMTSRRKFGLDLYFFQTFSSSIGSSAKHGAHQVAKKLIKTTFPFNDVELIV